MKKKIFVMLLCFCMTAVLMPAMAFGEDEDPSGPANYSEISSSVSTYEWEFEYTGSSVTQTFLDGIVWKDTALTEGEDFSVSYLDDNGDALESTPVDVGKHEICLTGLGDYEGSTWTVEIEIYSVNDIRRAEFSMVSGYTYTGSPVVLNGPTEPIYATMDEKDLAIGKDFVISKYYNDGDEELLGAPTAIGSYKVEFAGHGTYTGSKKLSFYIYDAHDLSNAILSMNSDYAYTGSPVKLSSGDDEPEVTINNSTLTAGTDYTISYLDSNGETLAAAPSALGSYTAVFTGKGSYSGEATSDFAIYPANDLRFATYGNKYSYSYTGNPVVLDVEVIMNGKKLVEGTDYTLSYYDNQIDSLETAPSDIGNYSFAVTGKGNYQGESQSYMGFEIVAANDIAAAEIEMPNEYDYTGKPVTIAPTVTLGKFTLTKDVDYTLSFEDVKGNSVAAPTELGDYYMTVTGVGSYTGTNGVGFSIVNNTVPPASLNFQTLTFDTGGSAISTYYAVSGTSVDLSTYVPTREGYDFIGWYSDSALKNKITSLTLSSNATVYAGWKKVTIITPIKDLHIDISTIKALKRGNKLTWTISGDADVDGFQIFRSRFANKGFGKTPFFTVIRPYYLNTLRDPSMTYYYKVRAFKITENGKVFSPFSKVVVCKPNN